MEARRSRITLDSNSMKDSGPTSPAPSRSRPQRQELNHLLGFTLPVRAPQSTTSFSGPPRRSTRRNAGHGIYDKQKFVNAQMRFVLKPTGDYTAHFADPDIFFEWPDVLQVIIPTTSALASTAKATLDHQHDDSELQSTIPTCPICLSVPTAARMTKCGHVFCFPCMLHYLELADGTKWRKCPVCWDAIYAKDLKTVKWFDPLAAAYSSDLVSDTPAPPAPLPDPFRTTNEQRSAPEPLKMRLIRRPQNTTLALPRSSTWPSEAVPLHRTPWEFTPDSATFAKFMLGSPDYIRLELEANLVELKAEIATLKRWGGSAQATDEELGIVFVVAAIKKVGEQLEKALELKTSFVMTNRKMALRELKEISDQVEKDGERIRLPPIETSSSEVEELPFDFLTFRNDSVGGGGLSSSAAAFEPSQHSASSTSLASPPSMSNGKPRPQRRNVNPPPLADTTFFFYQAASGLPIYLDALSIKILKASFGTYENFPSTISVTVEGHEEGSMNEELRRRCRYLSHLPTGSDIVFLETDLSSIVSSRTLESFSPALKLRRQKRRDKGRREDKAKATSERKEIESRPSFGHLEINPSSYVFARQDFGPGSHSNPYTSIPYAGFLQSANFPMGMTTRISPPVVVGTTNEGEVEKEREQKTVWGTTSFATALHSSSRPTGAFDEEYEGFDERWHEFEESNGRRGGSSQGGSAGGSNAGGGTPGSPAGGGGKKKKGKRLVLNLTGATRGSA